MSGFELAAKNASPLSRILVLAIDICPEIELATVPSGETGAREDAHIHFSINIYYILLIAIKLFLSISNIILGCPEISDFKFTLDRFRHSDGSEKSKLSLTPRSFFPLHSRDIMQL